MIPGLIDHIWQSTLFAGAAGLLALALRKNRAQVRYWIWFTASVKFLIPFSLLIGLGSLMPRRASAPILQPVQPVWFTAAVQIGEPLVSLPDVAVRAVPADPVRRNYFAIFTLAVWACGALAIALFWMLRWNRVLRLRKAAVPMSIPDVTVPVLTASDLVEPGVFGIFRPVLLLPEGITEQLSASQLDAILAHELCHVRRRDNLTAAIHMIVQSGFWFHPLVWWLGTRLTDERERACDEEVLRLGNKPRVYAEGILNVCKLYVESPVACVSGVTGADLKRRIEAIMKNRMVLRLNFAKRLVLSVAATAALTVPIAIGILHAPVVQAQSSQSISQPAAQPIPVQAAPVQVAQARPAPSPAPAPAPRPADPQPASEFEVASVRPSNPEQGLINAVTPSLNVGGDHLLRFNQITLRDLIMLAYSVGATQIQGPSFLNGTLENPADRFDIAARVPVGATPQQVPLMLRALLADRFHLSFHRDTKTMQIYALEVGKNGTKMKESPEGATGEAHCTRSFADPNGATPALAAVCNRMRSIDIAQQIQALAPGYFRDGPVVDLSNLKGVYDFRLEWITAVDAKNGVSGPSMMDAVQDQLGLKLERRRQAVETLVIDKLDRTPTDN